MVALTRFFRNPKVTAREIVATAAAHTGACAAGRHVLLIEDTSEINYQAKASRKRGLGRVGNGTDAGLFVHPVLALDAADATLLGLAAATIWCRSKAKAKDYQAQPIETKESHRWIETAQRARVAVADAACATVVADREGDIYELFARLPDARTHLLIRCNHNRVQAGTAGLLGATIAAWPDAGRLRFDLPARPLRPKRSVDLAVRFGPVTIRKPAKTAHSTDPKTVALTLVEVRETDPPAGQAAVIWRLYTTHPIATLSEAAWLVDLYRRRWTIEQVFRTLKSKGLAIEDSLIADADALKNLVATALIAAVRVMQCVQARGEAGASVPATRLFQHTDMAILLALTRKLEGKTQKQKNPYPIESLAWATWVIARLGGWKGSAKERPPGPITMLRGLQRYDAIAEGFALAL